MEDPGQFEDNGCSYGEMIEVYLAPVISRLEWKKSELLLDYGCGPGSAGAKFFFPLLEAYDSKMISVDISNKMIDYARKKYPNARVTYKVGNIMDENTPFPLEIKFDKIFLVNVMHYIKDYSKAFGTFFSHLKAKGHCTFSVILQTPVFKLHKALGENQKWSTYLKGIREITPEWIFKEQDVEEEYRMVLKDAGFEIIDLKTVSQKLKFNSIDMLIELYCSLNRFTRNIPEELLAQFKSDVGGMLTPFCKSDSESNQMYVDYSLLQGLVTKPVDK